MRQFFWLEKREILAFHLLQLREHGGGFGVRDEGLLDSALARPQNAYAYGNNDPHDLAMLYCSGISRNHPFVDGNKRAAYVAMFIFLARHGYEFSGDLVDAATQMLSFAAGEVSDEAMAAWLRANTVEV